MSEPARESSRLTGTSAGNGFLRVHPERATVLGGGVPGLPLAPARVTRLATAP
ncbi:Uncharacterised protein [Mycobacteroides abscessus subsp. abscessus]|nr:Uncharacterised protein [Mycobacteroides abscessus subsp. abscessus]